MSSILKQLIEKVTITFSIAAVLGFFSGLVVIAWTVFIACFWGYSGPYDQESVFDYTVFRFTHECPSTLEEKLDDDGFIISDSSSRKISWCELACLKRIDDTSYLEVLQRCKAEIFARHGRLSRKDKFHVLFSEYEWYDADAEHKVKVEDLSKVERKNIKLIEKIIDEITGK